MPNIRVKHRNIVIQDPVSAIAKIIVYDFYNGLLNGDE